MFDWFILRFHGMLDWLSVIATVFAIVFICQFMINFLKIDHDKNDDKDAP